MLTVAAIYLAVGLVLGFLTNPRKGETQSRKRWQLITLSALAWPAFALPIVADLISKRLRR